MIEKERKFLLKKLPDGLEFPIKIKQGYVMLDKDKHLRVRICEQAGIKTASITFKSSKDKYSRYEFEYNIPVSDATELYKLSKYKLIKTRYHNIINNQVIDIDIYPSGLKIVEIEFTTTLKNIPNYCGKEITGIKKYSNISIAKSNIKK